LIGILSTHASTNTSDFMKSLFSCIIPKEIKFADDILIKSPKIQHYTVSEMEQRVAKQRGIDVFSWTESVLVEEDFTIPTQEIPEISPKVMDGLVICNMGKQAGWGLFTQKRIPKDTVICVYSGKLLGDSEKPDPEDFYYHKGDGSSRFCSGKKYGGFSSFIQHLPLANRSGRFYYASNQGAGNLHLRTEGDVISLITLRDIQANEMLGYEYGSAYWEYLYHKKNISEIPFSRYGEPIGDLKCEFSYLEIYHIVYLAAKTLSMQNPNSKDLINYLKKIEENLIAADTVAARLLLQNLQNIADPMGAVYSYLIFKHIDFIRILPREERVLLLNFLEKNQTVGSIATIQERKNSFGSNFKFTIMQYIQVLSTASSNAFFHNPSQIFTLQIPSELFACNADRYFVYLPQKMTVEEAIKKSNTLARNAALYYSKQDYRTAIDKWQDALRLLRNIFSGDLIACESVVADDRDISAIDETRTLYWNLGSAYLKIDNITEAHYCLIRAVAIAEKTHHVTLEKYQMKLTEIQDRLSATEIEEPLTQLQI